MQVLNCLIVEDEPLAAAIVKDYIEQLPGLTLKGICGDVFSASEKLRTEQVDLIFLDINLPKISGLDFIRTLSGNYKVILTTAYHEYALEGFNLNVVDYLLKPIEFSRFVQAVNKIRVPLPVSVQSEGIHEPFYFFYSDKKQVRVDFKDIVYIESLKDYIKIHTSENKLVTKLPIGEVELLLGKQQFFRIHKSYVVNLNKISSYTHAQVEIGGKELPIGRVYKDLFVKEMRSREAKSQ